ncbi:MAG: hypothetical protein JWN82_382, partial [Candidatus Saccharibacteria bacterium]|nr:hypothetical protein [Candidatus Saccharibacteria bacterium]
MGEPAYKLPEEDRPDIRPHLREQEARPQLGVIEGGGESSPRSEGHLRSVDDEDEAPENDELGTGSSSGPSQRGFYRPEGGSGSTKGGANTEAVTQNAEGQSRLSKFKNRYFEGAGKF